MDNIKDVRQSSRVIWLDYFKGILVVVMILAHSIQFFGDESKVIQGAISKFANLTTFSGFLFVFGATNAVTYLRKPAKQVYHKMAKSFWRNLFAYYVSAFAYCIFVEGSLFLPQKIMKILGLRVLMGYSEFLLAFAVMQLIVILLFRLFARMNSVHFLIFAILSMAGTFFPYDLIKEPILALLVGSDHYNSFPIFPYLIYFSAGVWYINKAQQFTGKKKWILIISSILISLPSIIYTIINHALPKRFSPDLLFLLGAGGAVMLYTLFSKLLEKRTSQSFLWERIFLPLRSIGQNSLLFLLISNLVLFALKGTAFYRQSMVFVIVIFIIILYFNFFIVKITKREDHEKQTQYRKIETL
jgi:uncharacterized membrane protein